VAAPPPSSPAAAAAAAATPLLPTFALTSIPLGAFFEAGGNKDDLAARLGQCMVLGAGRPVGSALVALLHSQGVPVRAVDDGRTGFVSTVPFEVAHGCTPGPGEYAPRPGTPIGPPSRRRRIWPDLTSLIRPV
jgi:hypothetical protein